MRGNKTGLVLAAALFAVLLLTSCFGQGDGNMPYEPDTPEPAPHEGVFVSDWGTMTFRGDGQNVTMTIGPELAEIFGLPEGEYPGTYVFLSGDLPPHGSIPVRSDIAHELKIELRKGGEGSAHVFAVGLASDDGSSGTVGVGMVTPERIPLLFSDGGFRDVQFLKG